MTSIAMTRGTAGATERPQVQGRMAPPLPGAVERIHYTPAAKPADPLLPGLLAGAGIVALGIGAAVAGGRLGNGLLGIGGTVAAATGMAVLLGACTPLPQPYVVRFATEADLSGVPPTEVYNVLKAHHDRNAPAVLAELGLLKQEGKVRDFSAIIGNNGFVVDVVGKHREEVTTRLSAIEVVGSVEAAKL